jgi:hypothetical protein
MADTTVSTDIAPATPPISTAPAGTSALAASTAPTAPTAPTGTTAPAATTAPTVTTAPVGKKARKRNDDNEAIVSCMRAWNYTYKKGRAEDLSDYQAEKAANQAYLRAAPPLRGYKNICDFIACINFASISDIVIPRDAQHYLANAKLALTAVLRKPKPSTAPAGTTDLTSLTDPAGERRPVGRPPKPKSPATSPATPSVTSSVTGRN